MKHILVTGAGALLGQGIIRCLRFAEENYKIITADPSVYATGHAMSDIAYTIPFISAEGYQERIEEIIVKEKIDIILIGTDVELPFFAEKKAYFEQKFKLTVVVSSERVIEIANNKWLTAEFLREHNFPYPMSALTTDAPAIEALGNKQSFPLFAKPVDGARSMGIEVINDATDLKRVCSYPNNLVVQEYLSEAEGEFTTGCLVLEGTCVAIVSLVRDLRDGNTWRAFRKGDSPFDDTIKDIAESLGAEGPVNFQYRIKDGKPVIFEINCRFSGTTPLRLMFGFNEVEQLINFYTKGEAVKTPVLREGTVLRAFSDIFVANDTLAEFKDEGKITSLASEYFPFKVEK